MEDKNIDNESDVANDITKGFEKLSYEDGKRCGTNWFLNNIDAINELIPKGSKISHNFTLNNEITVLYEGSEKNPRVEFVSYDHWLNHSRYKEIEKSLLELCNLKAEVFFGISPLLSFNNLVIAENQRGAAV